MTKLHTVLRTCYLWLWLAPPLMTMQYVTYFQFRGCLCLLANFSLLMVANAIIHHGRCEGYTHPLPSQHLRQTSAFTTARGDGSKVWLRQQLCCCC